MINADKLFDAFPDLFFGSLKRQMFMGILPSETVETLLKPLLEDYYKIMPQLSLKLQEDIEDILKIYPEIAEEYAIDNGKEILVTPKLKGTLTQAKDFLKEFVSSLLWIPEGAGDPIVAADISEQENTIETDEGKIRITCVWGGETDDDPAYIWVKWDADMKPDAEFVIQIINPETHKIYYEIRPGKIRNDTVTIESEELKFDPTEMKWGIAVTKDFERKS
jgi:hypothetical protein